MTHNRFSNFYGIYTVIQVVHTKFIKVVLTDYSAFRSSCKMIEPNSGWAFSKLLTDGGERGGKRPPIPKICHTYPTVMKLGTAITYLKKIQKIYESRDTPPDFC